MWLGTLQGFDFQNDQSLTTEYDCSLTLLNNFNE